LAQRHLPQPATGGVSIQSHNLMEIGRRREAHEVMQGRLGKIMLKTSSLARLTLKNPFQILPIKAVFRALKNFLHRPAIRMGMARDARGPLRDPRFVSFMAQNNRTKLDTNFHDAVMNGRRLLRHGLVILVVVGCTWVVIESAKALSVF